MMSRSSNKIMFLIIKNKRYELLPTGAHLTDPVPSALHLWLHLSSERKLSCELGISDV